MSDRSGAAHMQMQLAYKWTLVHHDGESGIPPAAGLQSTSQLLLVRLEALPRAQTQGRMLTAQLQSHTWRVFGFA